MALNALMINHPSPNYTSPKTNNSSRIYWILVKYEATILDLSILMFLRFSLNTIFLFWLLLWSRFINADHIW